MTNILSKEAIQDKIQDKIDVTKTKCAKTKCAKTKCAKTKDIDTKCAKTKCAKTKDIDTKDIDTKDIDTTQVKVLKKRGRKKKVIDASNSEILLKEKPPPKKRGRKPRGGKFIEPATSKLNMPPQPQNIILHLKCCLKDLLNNNKQEEIQSYNFKNKSGVLVNKDSEFKNIMPKQNNNYTTEKDSETNILTTKLLELAIQLHTNNIIDEKSACFWCTYDFDNPPIHIPTNKLNNSYHCYGCFCSPECATAYLFKESIDSSTRFERYHLLNYLYSKIYNYNKNIKPAPSPYYMLMKYYGNLSIQEYRELLKNERLLLIIDKPLTRVLPELHDDNSSFLNTGIVSHNTYKVRRKAKPVSKSEIVEETFSGK